MIVNINNIHNLCSKFNKVLTQQGGWDSVVILARLYGLDCPDFESRWKRLFLCPSSPSLLAPKPNQPSVGWVTWLCLWVKRPGLGAEHPLHSSANVVNGLERYLRLLSVTFNFTSDIKYFFINT